MANEGTHYGPRVVTDSLVFCFDAGNLRCTHRNKYGNYTGSNDVTSMYDVAPVLHSSQASLGGQSNPECKGIIGTGNTGNFSFPTDQGASKVIDLSISSYRSQDDADDYDNRLTLHDDIYFADEDAWSFEFWGKLHTNCINTYQSLGGPGGTTRWIIQHKSGANSWTIRYREHDGTYRTSATQTDDARDWHQMFFTVAADRTMKQYINGVLISTHTLTSSTLTLNRIMASYSSSTNRYGYEGVMLCCRAYAKELSADEVKQNFEATRWRVNI